MYQSTVPYLVAGRGLDSCRAARLRSGAALQADGPVPLCHFVTSLPHCGRVFHRTVIHSRAASSPHLVFCRQKKENRYRSICSHILSSCTDLDIIMKQFDKTEVDYFFAMSIIAKTIFSMNTASVINELVTKAL